jgi:nicotinamidase/pyrazinamidase
MIEKGAVMKIDFAHSALLEIDVQNDFCPGGTLAVDKVDEVVDPLNRLASRFAENGAKVLATQDWHPRDHVSFASSHPGRKPGDAIDITDITGIPGVSGSPGVKGQILWPSHCVQGGPGAAFHPRLDLSAVHLIIRKGYRKELDSYSAFFENDRKTPTGLEGLLKGLGITTVVLGGLAADYCVLYSALDAAARGFKTLVIRDAVRGVGFPEGSVERAFALMEEAGVVVAGSEEIA